MRGKKTQYVRPCFELVDFSKLMAVASPWNPLAKEAGLPFVELDGEEEWDVNTHDWQIQ